MLQEGIINERDLVRHGDILGYEPCKTKTFCQFTKPQRELKRADASKYLPCCSAGTQERGIRSPFSSFLLARVSQSETKCGTKPLGSPLYAPV